MLEAYKSAASIKLQVYRARPRTLLPPTAFVDRISEELTDFTAYVRQRQPSVHVIVVHGLFDSGEATDQGDAFVDGFLDWVADDFHGFGANTLVNVTRTEDIPNFVPDWVRPEEQKSYYATEITLEGFAAT